MFILTTMSLISEKRRGYACDRISFFCLYVSIMTQRVVDRYWWSFQSI